jgi:hypothetical protein
MRRIIRLVTLCSVVLTGAVFAHGNDGKAVLIGDTLYYTNNSRHFSMSIRHETNGTGYVITLRAKTKGWLAAGFERTVIMKDAEIILGYVKNGQGFFTHDFGVGQVWHAPISSLDPVMQMPMLTLISSEEKNGITTLVFNRPSTLSGKYFKEFYRGKKMEFMYAIGSQDESGTKHAERGAADIVLP